MNNCALSVKLLIAQSTSVTARVFYFILIKGNALAIIEMCAIKGHRFLTNQKKKC